MIYKFSLQSTANSDNILKSATNHNKMNFHLFFLGGLFLLNFKCMKWLVKRRIKENATI